MAPQKMLYIKEEDLGLIDKAQLCSGENFSNTVVRALRWYVDSQQDIDFELQKLTIGFECVADYPFYSGQNIPEEFEEDEEAYPNLVFDELLPKVFPKTKVTFFGAEIFSSREKYVGIRGIPALTIHKNIIVNAFNGDFDNTKHIELFNTQDFDYMSEEIPKMPITALFTVFSTRGGKFLILVDLDDLKELRDKVRDDEYYIPDISDYSILEELNENETSIVTATYGLEVDLPENFIRRVLATIETASQEKHLDI